MFGYKGRPRLSVETEDEYRRCLIIQEERRIDKEKRMLANKLLNESKIRKKNNDIKKRELLIETQKQHIDDLINDKKLLFELLDTKNVTNEEKMDIFDKMKG